MIAHELDSAPRRRVLIVAPHFPPVNAPDAQRVRMSLAHYRAFGWEPHVLTVDPDRQPGARDAAQAESLPPDVPVTRAGALPLRLTRLLGIGDTAIRGFGALARAGERIIRREQIDLVFFSTSLFFCLALGRVWRARTGTPFVIDMQDPWASDYVPSDRPALKRRAANHVHRRLERWTMRDVGGVMAVSPAYVETLRRRYSWIAADACATVPFGVSPDDFAVAARRAEPAAIAPAGRCHGVYVGAGGPAMAAALRILFTAIRRLEVAEAISSPLALSFVGTDYAPAGRGTPSVMPIARDIGVAARVSEQTDRIGYFSALRTLQTADFVLLIGSDDPQYTASKALPCIAAGRPLLAIVHAKSPVNDVLARYAGAIVITFHGRDDVERAVEALVAAWPRLMAMAGRDQPVDWTRLEPFTARALTAAQCALFDRVVGHAPRSTAPAGRREAV